MISKNIMKLVMNLYLIGASMLPRGGVVSFDLSEDQNSKVTDLCMTVKGPYMNKTKQWEDLLTQDIKNLDSHNILMHYVNLLAKKIGLECVFFKDEEKISVTYKSIK